MLISGIDESSLGKAYCLCPRLFPSTLHYFCCSTRCCSCLLRSVRPRHGWPRTTITSITIVPLWISLRMPSRRGKGSSRHQPSPCPRPRPSLPPWLWRPLLQQYRRLQGGRGQGQWRRGAPCIRWGHPPHLRISHWRSRPLSMAGSRWPTRRPLPRPLLSLQDPWLGDRLRHR